MLVDHVLESQNAGLLESVLMPFDIYNDSAQQALVVLKQRFLYDEIEAEVLLYFTDSTLLPSIIQQIHKPANCVTIQIFFFFLFMNS